MDQSNQEQRDIVDSIRLEASSLSPQEHQRMLDIGNHFGDIIEKDFGRYIPEERKRSARETIRNMIGVDSPALLRYALNIEIPGIRDLSELTEKVEHGFHGNTSGVDLIVYRGANEYDQLSEEQKETFTRMVQKDYPFVSDNRTFFKLITFYTAIAHEVGHAYTSPSSTLMELYARYMQDYIMGKELHFSVDSKLRAFVNERIKKHGEDFYKAMFGNPREGVGAWAETREAFLKARSTLMPLYYEEE